MWAWSLAHTCPKLTKAGYPETLVTSFLKVWWKAHVAFLQRNLYEALLSSQGTAHVFAGNLLNQILTASDVLFPVLRTDLQTL